MKLLSILIAFNSVCAAAAESPVVIAADQQRIHIEATQLTGRTIRVLQLQPFEQYDAKAKYPIVWRGKVGSKPISFPRFAAKRDRLYSKFQFADAQTGEPLGNPQYVTDLSDIGARDFDFLSPKSIKGLQVQMADDAIALGVKHAALNVNLSNLFDWTGKSPETHEIEGETVHINKTFIDNLDRRCRAMTDAGVNITAILLNYLPADPQPGYPMIHPKTDVTGAPNRLGAFNTAEARGLLYYRAALQYLANRYSDRTARHGWISGYIIGNEIQSHWYWYNMGKATMPEVANEYSIALRIADLTLRQIHSKLRTYISLEHHWNMPYLDNPLQSCRGKELLEQINARIQAEGDIPWHLAFHPYPQNLFEPRTWKDGQTSLNFDTKKITFKNIEVLPAFMHQEQFLYKGQPRRIILSEQGFHSPDGPDGEKAQAAGYAYAYHKLRNTPGIDAFILHRHVDHKHEGGLRLGLWTWKEDGGPVTPDRKKFIYDVFRLADTDQWQEAFEFAKPIIGIQSWDEILPSKAIGVTTAPAPATP